MNLTRMILCAVAATLQWLVTINKAEQLINRARLTEQVFLVCGGNYLCNQDVYGLKSEDFQTNELFKICPRCDCSQDCYIAGNCCPDVYFNFPRFEFIKTSLLDENLGDTSSVLGIVNCNPDADSIYRDSCLRDYDVEGLIRNPIVTSSITNMTYKNAHCANCRGEKNVEEWNWGVACPLREKNKYRFNYLSDLQDIIKLAKHINCIIELQPIRKEKTYFQKYPTSNSNAVTECNLTGTWVDFDKDIHDACLSSYENRFGAFKNIFCYMCNPPRGKEQFITSCNETGLWEKYDDQINMACNNLPTTHSTGIFKNVFCFMCNVYSDLTKKKDVNVKMDSIFEYPSFQYDIRIQNFRDNFFNELILGKYFHFFPFDHWMAENVDSSYLYRTKYLIKRNNEIYNVTKLIQYMFAHDAISLCNEDHIPKPYQRYLEHRTCSCDPKCIFDNKCKCCPDLSLTYPTACIKDQLYPEDSKKRTEYLVTDGCYGKDTMTSFDDEIENLCVSGNDTVSKIIIADWQSNVLYKNIFCYLCNKNFVIDQGIKVTSKYRPWRLILKCDQNIDFVFTPTLLDQIDLAVEMKCEITMEPYVYSRSCEEHFYELKGGYPWETINTCNETGLWDSSDRDIAWACEGLRRDNIAAYWGQYRNIFCKFCNTPMLTYTDKNYTCTNISIDIHGTELAEACASLPYVDYGSYKNRFCSLCDESFLKTFSTNGLPCECQRSDCGTDVIDNIPPILRDVFVVNVMTYTLPEKKSSDDFRVYDSVNGKYREIKCYPGKYWNGKTCRSTLRKAIHMKYSLDVALFGYLNGEITESGQEILDKIAYRFLDSIKLMKIERMGLSYTSIYSKGSCLTLEKSTNSTLDVYLNAHFYFDAAFDRDFVEESLLDVYDVLPNISIPLQNGSWELSEIRHNRLQTLDAYENVGYSCSKRWMHNSQSPFVNGLKVSAVNKMLFCKQIRLSKQECFLSLSSTELVCTKLDFRASLGHFLVLEHSFAVCAEDIIPHFNKPLPKAVKVSIELGYLTNVCILVSLSCLFITFFTYCMFKKLRTAPGLLTMSLVFSIFASQIILTYGVSKLSLGIYCEIIGIFAHYLWLCMFACTNVCSYHMFSSFKGIYDGNLTNTTNRKTLILYFVYSYVLPSIVVGGNIAVIYHVSGHTGYGGGICFLANSTSRIVSMVTPACLVCILNISFFVRTVFYLRSLPDLKGTRVERNNFVIFVKLFSITGTLWTLQIIDSFIPDMSILTYITSVLNGLQGVYIFLSYVCNKNVLSLYSSLCCKRNLKLGLTKTTSNQSSSTMDTSLKYKPSVKQIPHITY